MSIVLSAFRFTFRLYSQLLPGHSASTARKLMMTPRVKKNQRSELPAPDRVVQTGQESYLSVWEGVGPHSALLIHGWSGSPEQFTQIFASFRDRDYTIYIVHPAGHGPSTAKISHPLKFVESIRLAAEFIKKPVDVAIGHSMGAGALAVCASEMQLFKKLVLISGPASFEGVLRRFAKFLNLSEKATNAFLRHVESFVRYPTEQLNVSERCKNISAPVLIVHDELDREIPFEDSLVLKAACSNGTHLSTNRLGHRKLLGDPDVVGAIAEFSEKLVSH